MSSSDAENASSSFNDETAPPLDVVWKKTIVTSCENQYCGLRLVHRLIVGGDAHDSFKSKRIFGRVNGEDDTS